MVPELVHAGNGGGANSSDQQESRGQSFKSNFQRHKSVAFLIVSQIGFIILLGCLSEYSSSAKPSKKPLHPYINVSTHDRIRVGTARITDKLRVIEADNENTHLRLDIVKPEINEVVKDYALFQDVHVMIFIGFGFLMTFLKRYAYSAVSINLLLAAYAIQWHTIFLGFFEIEGKRFHIGLLQMILSEFCAGSILISMGAVLGKLSPIQYLVMAFFEVIFYTFNEYVVFLCFWANDVGGSMNLHTFGAYFGLTIARILYDEKVIENRNESTVYYSNLFSIIGCLFLWMYWPSFNGGISAPDDARMRAVINTYYSLAACTLSTFAFSAMFHKDTQFDMDLIQNATLAGGVAIGSSANLMVSPVGAVIVGTIAGILSVSGFEYIQPFLEHKFKLHDTCGVHNLHGMPGILGGIVSIIMCAIVTPGKYGHTLHTVLPAMGDMAGVHNRVAPNRSAGIQAGFQVAALVVSLAFAIVGGMITGFILKIPIFDNIKVDEDFFNDDVFFETTEDFAQLGEMIATAEIKRHTSGANIRHSDSDLSERSGRQRTP